MQEKTKKPQEISNESWDFKKIGIALLILAPILLLVFSYKDLIVAGLTSSNPKPIAQEEVKETPQLKPDFSGGAGVAQQKIDSIRSQVQELDFEELATSSPQVQKIINDIKSLPDYPHSQAKDMCIKLCEGI